MSFFAYSVIAFPPDTSAPFPMENYLKSVPFMTGCVAVISTIPVKSVRFGKNGSSVRNFAIC